MEGGCPSIAIWLPNNDWWLPNTTSVKAQQLHLFICGKHNSQMNLYVQKWESIKVYLKLLYLMFLDFQGCSHCRCFLSLMPIHSVSHTYIEAVCSTRFNLCLHFTRPRAIFYFHHKSSQGNRMDMIILLFSLVVINFRKKQVFNNSFACLTTPVSMCPTPS